MTHITVPTVFNGVTRDGVRRETVYRETELSHSDGIIAQ